MAAEEAQEPPRPVAAADVTACAIQSWYPTFKKHTIRTVLLELDADFLKYLDADGIVLPTPIGPCAEGDPRAAVSSPRSSTSSEEGAGGSSSGASEAPPDRAVSFPALERSIQAALDTMPRGAFVKTSWSSVQDAVWASGTLQCTTPGEVFMLLKCSDMVAFDMHKAYEACPEPPSEAQRASMTLALRSWSSLHRSQEWRMFVVGNEVVAVCQRHVDTKFEHLAGKGSHYGSKLVDWWEGVVAEHAPLNDYALDVYIDRAERVWIVDFAPLGGATLPLLFSWEDIDAMALVVQAGTDGGGAGDSTPPPAPPGTSQVQLPSGALVRLVSNPGVRPSAMQVHSLPTDIVQLASDVAAGTVDPAVQALLDAHAGVTPTFAGARGDDDGLAAAVAAAQAHTEMD